MRANDMSAADPDRNEDSFIPPAETDAYPDALSWLILLAAVLSVEKRYLLR